MLRIVMSVCGEVSLLHPFRILSLRRRTYCLYDMAVQKCLKIKCFLLLFMQGGGGKGLHTLKNSLAQHLTSKNEVLLDFQELKNAFSHIHFE